MSSQPRARLTPLEYLTLDRQAEHKSEYYGGEVFAMAGGSERHNLIVGNAFAGIHAQFRKRPCRVYASDMRVKVSPAGMYAYPDVMAVCGEVRFDDEQRDTLLNPSVIVEVLSESTEGYDRGKKFESYRRLDSLVEYVLIAQDAHRVEHYVRQTDNRWLMSEYVSLQDTLSFPSLSVQLSLADIYDKVEADRAA